MCGSGSEVPGFLAPLEPSALPQPLCSPDHQWQQFLSADGFSSNRRLACFTEHHSGAGYGDVAAFSTWGWRGANLRSHRLTQWFLYIVIFQLVLNSFNFVCSLGKYAGEMWVSGPEECPQDLGVFCGLVTSSFAGPSKCLSWSMGRARSREDASRAESALPAEAEQAKAWLCTPCTLSTGHPPSPAAPEGTSPQSVHVRKQSLPHTYLVGMEKSIFLGFKFYTCFRICTMRERWYKLHLFLHLVIRHLICKCSSLLCFRC